MDLSFYEQLLRVVFSTFCGLKKKYNLKHCSVRIQKLHSMKLKKNKKNLGRTFFWVKIGYHSNLNPECNTKRGCKNQLYIELGLEPQISQYQHLKTLYKTLHFYILLGRLLFIKLRFCKKATKFLRNNQFRFDVYYIQSNLRWRIYHFVFV